MGGYRLELVSYFPDFGIDEDGQPSTRSSRVHNPGLVLQVKKDLGLPIIYAGLVVMTLGVFATFYIAHRRWWAFTEDGQVIVGGWTNRNAGSFEREMREIAHRLDPERYAFADEMEGDER